jgi:hypothetical protein
MTRTSAAVDRVVDLYLAQRKRQQNAIIARALRVSREAVATAAALKAQRAASKRAPASKMPAAPVRPAVVDRRGRVR